MTVMASDIKVAQTAGTARFMLTVTNDFVRLTSVYRSRGIEAALPGAMILVLIVLHYLFAREFFYGGMSGLWLTVFLMVATGIYRVDQRLDA